jgi:hypothetical protein
MPKRTSSRTQVAQAGLPDDRLPHPFLGGTRRPREVRLEGPPGERYLAYDPRGEFDDPLRDPEKPRRPEGCIWEFLQLTKKPEERILPFVQKWGVLELCEHGDPATHEQGDLLQYRERTGCEKFTGREYVRDWQAWARRVLALLRVAGALREERFGPPEDWAVLSEWAWSPLDVAESPEDWPGHTLWDRKQRVTQVFDEWQWMGWVRAFPESWAQTSPRPVLLGKGLFGLIAAQVYGVLLSGAPPAQCAWPECRNPIWETESGRRPRGDRPNYCSEECRAEAQREIQRRSKQRQRRAKQQPHHTATGGGIING